MAIIQGHGLQAINFHLFGPMLFLICLGIVAHVTVELVTQKKQSTVFARLLKHRKPQFLSLGIYLGYYCLRLLWLGHPDESGFILFQNP